MKSRVKKLAGTAREINIEMPKEAVDEAFREVLEEIRQTATIPGFRSGKAPMDIIEKNYGKEAIDEMKKRLIPLAYQKVLEEHDISPASYPEISDIVLHLAGQLTFRVKVDCTPEVKLKKYKGFKVACDKVSVTSEEVEETLKHFREMSAEFEDTQGPISKGEYGICDVETFIDGKPVSKKRENMWIQADKESSMLGMGEELRGLKKGDKKEVEVTLPENYPDKNYARKKAIFKVEVKETKKKNLPELDDEFAGKIGKGTLEEVRSDIKTNLMARKEANEKVKMKNQIMEQLLKKHVFDVPESMVQRQLKVLMEKAESELLQRGVDKDQIGSHKEKLKEQLAKEARNKVCLYFILNEVADAEDISITDEETDDWLKALAGSYGQPFENVKKYYEEHNLMDGLKEQLREEKTLDYLLEEAVVVEK